MIFDFQCRKSFLKKGISTLLARVWFKIDFCFSQFLDALYFKVRKLMNKPYVEVGNKFKMLVSVFKGSIFIVFKKFYTAFAVPKNLF